MLFYLQKTIAAFVFPPGLYVTLLAGLGFFCLRRPGDRFRKRLAVTLLCFAGLVYFLSTRPARTLLCAWVESPFRAVTPAQLQQGDCYVLLGGGVNHDARMSLAAGKGEPATISAARAAEAAKLYRARPLPVIVSGGAVFAGNTVEAETLAAYLAALGVDPARIVRETESRNTAENAARCVALMKRNAWRRPVLVTSAIHMRRSVMAFRSQGMAVIPAPCDFWGNGGGNFFEGFLPSEGEAMRIRGALWEIVGSLF